jgi:hypothetical protein
MIHSADFKDLAERISYVDMAKYIHDLEWVEVPTKRERNKYFN